MEIRAAMRQKGRNAGRPMFPGQTQSASQYFLLSDFISSSHEAGFYYLCLSKLKIPYWWHRSIISVLWTLRQKCHNCKVSVACGKLKATLCNLMRPCLKGKSKKRAEEYPWWSTCLERETKWFLLLFVCLLVKVGQEVTVSMELKNSHN